MSFDRLSGELGDRDTSALRFMAQSSIEFIGQLHRRTLHGMPAYQGWSPEPSGTDAGYSDQIRRTGRCGPSAPDIAGMTSVTSRSTATSATDSLDRNPSSTGLGLAIVKRTIERRGGTVELVGGLAAGTAFRVTVPLADDPLPA